MKRFRPSKKTIAFVRAGEQSTPAGRTCAGILTSAKDWQLLVDLEHQLKFPSHIAVTTRRPGIVLVSESSKQAVQQELTVPCEDRLEEVSQQAGWRARCFPVEGGCRGFAARSLTSAFSSLGIEGERRRRAISSSTDVAERASRWL